MFTNALHIFRMCGVVVDILLVTFFVAFVALILRVLVLESEKA